MNLIQYKVVSRVQTGTFLGKLQFILSMWDFPRGNTRRGKKVHVISHADQFLNSITYRDMQGIDSDDISGNYWHIDERGGGGGGLL